LPPGVASAIFDVGFATIDMLQLSVEQVRRAFKIAAGFTLLLVGVIMLVTPGPGWLTIFLGLGLLAAEFVWARRLMDRIKREGGRIKDAVLRQDSSKPEAMREEGSGEGK
jgi:tellurite resistance protein TerC